MEPLTIEVKDFWTDVLNDGSKRRYYFDFCEDHFDKLVDHYNQLAEAVRELQEQSDE